jgi:serine/threonine-protein kinase
MDIVGTNVLQYRVSAKLGEGSTGEVYLADDFRAGRRVALKFLSRRFAEAPQAREAFEREAQAASDLDCEHIVDIVEFGEFEGRPFVATTYVEGESLADIIARGPLPVVKAVEIACQVAEALDKAHHAGIIHGGIKPSNIIVGDDGLARVTDFGLAAIDSETRLAADADPDDTGFYLAPEQARGEAVDLRADVFALGLVAYEMLTGQPPFAGDGQAAILQAIDAAAAEAPSKLNRNVSPALDHVILKMLAKKPEARQINASTAATELRTPPRRAVRRPVRRRRRKRSLVAVATIVVMAALVGAAWHLSLRPDTEPDLDGVGSLATIAVLPLENRGLPGDDYLAGGMTHTITIRLATIAGLGVTDPASARSYAHTDELAWKIGGELGVDYLLRGQVELDEAGEQLVVEMALLRLTDDTVIWSAAETRDVAELDRIQRELAAAVAGALELAPPTVVAPPTRNLAAYLDYYRGLDALNAEDPSPTTINVAMDRVERAIAADAEFALAHALLARVHLEAHRLGFDATPGRLELARAAAERAYALAPSQPEANLVLADVLVRADHDDKAALVALDRAALARPSDAAILAARGAILRRQGDDLAALDALELAFRLHPRDPALAVEVARTYQGLWRFEDAGFYAHRARTLDPGYRAAYAVAMANELLASGDLAATARLLETMPGGREPVALGLRALQSLYEGDAGAVIRRLAPHRTAVLETPAEVIPAVLIMAWAQDAQGDAASAHRAYEDALAALENRRAAAPGDFRIHAALALAHAGLDGTMEAERFSKQARKLAGQAGDAWSDAILARNLILVEAQLGQVDAALERLEDLLATPNPGLSPALAAIHPLLKPLRGDPRFLEIVGPMASSDDRS